jgi:hypothetical protein
MGTSVEDGWRESNRRELLAEAWRADEHLKKSIGGMKGAAAD